MRPPDCDNLVRTAFYHDGGECAMGHRKLPTFAYCWLLCPHYVSQGRDRVEAFREEHLPKMTPEIRKRVEEPAQPNGYDPDRQSCRRTGFRDALHRFVRRIGLRRGCVGCARRRALRRVGYLPVGDVTRWITDHTGIHWCVVTFFSLLNRDCGCEARQIRWNKLVRYRHRWWKVWTWRYNRNG